MKNLLIIASLFLTACSTGPINDGMMAVLTEPGLYYHQDHQRHDYEPEIGQYQVPELPVMAQGNCVDRAAWYVQAYLQVCDRHGIQKPDWIGYNDDYVKKHRTVLIRYGEKTTEIEPSTGMDVPDVWWLE